MDSLRAVVFLPLVAAVVLSAFVVGLRLNDRDPDDPGHHDPPGILYGFDSGADRVADAAFATGVTVAPDGTIFFAEHLAGRIVALVPSEEGLEARTILWVDLPPDGRLFHLVLHPDWPRQPYLYFAAHQGEGPYQRLAVFRARFDGLAPVAVTRVVAGLPTEDPRRGPEADHFGSALAVCDGYLYVSIGDTDSPGPGYFRAGGVRLRAQQPDAAEGKILRYRLDGPDLEPAGVLNDDPPAFAMGLRNVFGMDCDPRSPALIAADNGPAGRDQLRVIEAGSNHGWPIDVDRLAPTPPWYDSRGGALGPTGTVVRDVGGVREVLFSAFHTHAIYRLHFAEDGSQLGPIELAYRGTTPILALAQAGDHCVYFSTPEGIWQLLDDLCASNVNAVRAPMETASPARFDGRARDVYRANCAACHGVDRGGGVGPPLLAEELTASDERYIKTILEGRTNRGMPAWGDAGMTVAQAAALLDFLRAAPE